MGYVFLYLATSIFAALMYILCYAIPNNLSPDTHGWKCIAFSLFWPIILPLSLIPLVGKKIARKK